MYTISAVSGEYKLDLRDLFQSIDKANNDATERIQMETFNRKKLRELALDYKAQLQEVLNDLAMEDVKELQIQEHGMSQFLDNVRLTFGHGTAYVQLTFRLEKGDISAKVKYSGIDTFKHTEANIESVGQIVDFCSRPIQYLIIGHHVSDFKERKELQYKLID